MSTIINNNSNNNNTNLTNQNQTNKTNLQNLENSVIKKKVDITKTTIKSDNNKLMTSSNDSSSKQNHLPIISNNSKSESIIEQNNTSLKNSINNNNESKSKKISSKSKSYNMIEIKNLKNIRKENSTINNKLISISYKNLDLKKIVEKEKFAEMQKYHFLERFFDGSNIQYDQEKIFYNDPFENLDEDLIKYRSKFILRSGKLLMENKMHFSGDGHSNKYSFRKLDSEKISDINKKVKLNILEKDVENKKRILMENLQKEILNNNNNNRYGIGIGIGIGNNNDNDNLRKKDTEYINTSYKKIDKSTADAEDIYDRNINNNFGSMNFLKENINTDANLNQSCRRKFNLINNNNIDIAKEFEIKFTENNLFDNKNNNNKNIYSTNKKKKDNTH